MGWVTLGIILPIILLVIALVGVGVWYRRTIRHPATEVTQTISGTRLTAEALHRLSSPPWRIVYEIKEQLEGIDHVVVGPIGVVAVATSATNRPTLEQLHERGGLPMIIAGTAIARGHVDELLIGTGSCDMLARVFWGAADPQRHAAETSVHATAFVEGQRLVEWLDDWATHAPPVLSPAEVDRAWQSITVGIGRPDPTR
jgi:hypothetical protein